VLFTPVPSPPEPSTRSTLTASLLSACLLILPGSIEYDHFGFCVLITDEALKSVSIYLDGQRNQDEAASAPSSNPPSDTATLSPSDETLSSLVGEGVPVSAATAAVDNSKEESCVSSSN
jgi:hypothetical protein